MSDIFLTAQSRHIAYNRHQGQGPWVVFLPGFNSTKEGLKALYLDAWARARGQAFLRFDYSGHGASSGVFADGCIGDWAEDASAAISTLTQGPVVLVGSSMGGWISLLMAQRMAKRVAGLVTIAAAPDFTEDGILAGFTPRQRQQLQDHGLVLRPSAYGDPYPITRHMIEEGRDHLVLRAPLSLPMPVRLLHGTADADVPMERALRLLTHASGDDIRLQLVKDADHRFSTPDCLALLEDTLDELLSRLTAKETP